jgi:D-2-hydroxyacid dehydrogenase (NADP+)
MRVIGVKRSPKGTSDPVDAVVPPDRFLEVLREADYVALTCPLTPETEGLIGEAQLSAMKPSACLVNVARGRVVQEEPLVRALRDGGIAAAGLDTFHQEPLPQDSPFWGFDNVVITPHTAGETQLYEANIVDLLVENLGRLQRGETELKNGIV